MKITLIASLCLIQPCALKLTGKTTSGKGERLMLVLSRKIDQKIKIGDEIEITIIDVSGDTVKIG
jgi:hypothetical protein